MPYKVGEVARLAHVSVRTLHHYHEIGLVVPSERSEGGGHRLYTPEDLERLQQVLFYKELGFGLQHIRAVVTDPAFDRREALTAQRDLLSRRARRLEAMLILIDKTLAAQEGGIQMRQDEMFEVFGDFDPSEYEHEARERWGGSEAHKESLRRAKRYTRDDWARFKSESDEISSSIAALMDEGVAPSHQRAMDTVERHRLLIDSWFYPCSGEMHAQLGRMYVADPRFTATYEKVRHGMAQYVCDAAAANAGRPRPRS